jgi:competence protein ComEA
MKKVILFILSSTVFLFGSVDISSASKDELMTLSGIGEKKALEIIKTRDTNCFKSVDDLMTVKGIGQKTFDKLKKDITASGNCKSKVVSSKPNTSPTPTPSPKK